MRRVKTRINWGSKFVDLIIVIAGITIAFSLNTWKENHEKTQEQREYLNSFLDESRANKSAIQESLGFYEEKVANIDSLVMLLNDRRSAAGPIKTRSLNLLLTTDGARLTTTMDNITYSGEFGVIRDKALRREIVKTYNAFDNLQAFEELSLGYIKKYIGPILMENSTDRQLKASAFRSEMERVALIYEGSVYQQIRGCQKTIEQLDHLIGQLESALANL